MKEKAIFIFFLAFSFFFTGPVRAARAPHTDKVVIDAGHGGYDEGIVYDSGQGIISEKKVDLDLARAVAADLRAMGIKAFLVRPEDRYLSISQRAAIASAARPSLFLSIHLSSVAAFQVHASLTPQAPPAPQAPVPQAAPVNIAGGNLKAGAGAAQAGAVQNGPVSPTPEVLALRNYYRYGFVQRLYLASSRVFASMLEGSVQKAFPGKDVFYLEIPLALLDSMPCPAVLIECPGPQFMDYTNPSTVSGIAQAIAGAIMAYEKKR